MPDCRSVMPKRRARVALGIEVDDERLESLHRERGREVDRGGGFAHAALLVRDGEQPAVAWPRAAARRWCAGPAWRVPRRRRSGCRVRPMFHVKHRTIRGARRWYAPAGTSRCAGSWCGVLADDGRRAAPTSGRTHRVPLFVTRADLCRDGLSAPRQHHGCGRTQVVRATCDHPDINRAHRDHHTPVLLDFVGSTLPLDRDHPPVRP